MRRLVFVILITLIYQLEANAQSQNFDRIEEAIIFIYGLNSLEEMDEELLERMRNINKHRLKINNLSRSKLLSCGLFTQYQVASFLDYRDRYGDVLSYSELATLNGFNSEFVSALKYFISLDSLRLPGQSEWEGSSIYNTLITRGFIKNITEEFKPQYSYGLRYQTEINQKYFLRLGAVRSYNFKFHYPSAFTGTIAYQRRKFSVILGDFNLRFGQGLAIWNGMSLAGVSNVSSFIKKPTGLSLPSSFSSPTALTGLASDFSFGNFSLITFVSIPKLKSDVYKTPNKISFEDFLTGLNFSYYGRRYRLSFSQANYISSIDAAFCFYGIDLWGEFAFDWKKFAPVTAMGVAAPLGEMFKLAGLIRYFSPTYKTSYNGPVRTFSNATDELAISLGLDFLYGRKHSANLSLDYATRPSKFRAEQPLDNSQFKVLLLYSWKITPAFDLSFRGISRLKFQSSSSEQSNLIRQSPRNELRCDFNWEGARFGTKVRVHGAWAKAFAILSYCEVKYHQNSFSCYLRQGIFKVDNWDDRIYVYERDLPGSFSVPAYYGRGVWTALYMKYSIKNFLKIGLRAAYTPYFKNKKPSKAELKIQFTLVL